MGTGEKTEALEPFDPDRMARRILGMGDVVALVEDVRKNVDVEQADKLARKMSSGKGFDFNDLKGQLQQLLEMGGMAQMLDKLPGGAAMARKMPADRGTQLRRQIALIDSMTPVNAGGRKSSTDRAAAALQQGPGCRYRTSTGCSNSIRACRK